MKLKIIDDAFFQSLELLDIYLKDNVAGSFGGNHKSKKYGSSSEFADYREYIPGDDIRRVDWNAFSRFDKLYLKLFLDERQMHHRIYIDGSKSMENKKEHALKLAVAFAYLSIKAMDKVSIYVINGHKNYKLLNRIIGKEAFYNAIAAIDDVKFEGESFLRFAPNAYNEAGDFWLWFWIKNVGIVFVLLIPAFIMASRKMKIVYSGAFLLFIISSR